MGELEDLAQAISDALEALYGPQTPEIAPENPKEAVKEPYTYPKEPICPPHPALTAGMALPTPQRSVLEAFLEEICPFAQLTPPIYHPPNTRAPHKTHPARWNTPWTRAEILDLERRRLAGESLRDLGKTRGVSPARVAQVLAKARRHRQKARQRRRVRGVG